MSVKISRKNLAPVLSKLSALVVEGMTSHKPPQGTTGRRTMDGLNPADTLADPETVTRSDVAEIERAIRLKWELPADLAKVLPDRLVSLTQHSDPRIAIRAARALVEMNQQNEAGPDDSSEPPGQIHFYIPLNGRESMR